MISETPFCHGVSGHWISILRAVVFVYSEVCVVIET